MKIENLEFSIRTENLLKKLNIISLEDLLKFSEPNLRAAWGWGKKSIYEIRNKLATRNLCLTGDTIVSSLNGLELVSGIPEKLDNLKDQMLYIEATIRTILSDIERVRIYTENFKK